MEPVWDVAVVGAGPAGALAAVAALGTWPDARVLLLDRDDFPRDKVCGDALGPRIFDVLGRYGLGSLVDDYDVAGEFALESATTSARHRLRGPFRVVPRRVFDARLVSAARAAGAMWQRRHVKDVEVRRDEVVLDGAVRARVVVAADGAESRVRRQLAGLLGRPGRSAVAIRGYAPSRSPYPCILSKGERWPAYAWEFPTGKGVSNVGYIEVPDPGHSLTKTSLVASVERLLPDVAAGVPRWQGHRLPLASARPRVPDGRVLLTGDAGALVNPASGEGILDAVVSGALAGEAAVWGGDAGAVYRARLRQGIGAHQRGAALAARICRVDALAAFGLRMAAVDEAFFGSVLHLAMGDGRPRPLVTARAMCRAAARLSR